MLEDETCGWYALYEGTLTVWEGVCSLKLNDVIFLFKIRNASQLLEIRLPPDVEVRKVCSDGYWECVEVTGTFEKSSSMFYYHADNTSNARVMLENLIGLTSTGIQSLNIRLDPDPLRQRNKKQISDRIAMWS
ncbi:hypothetical protein GCK32_010568 [Trichostrongylus colubriformis]|uniref:Uncharacterized protein n=1 Tax=Trichostrongylus colubriformis TaxID=6319 RepID=A0AAN8IA40_TRICO